VLANIYCAIKVQTLREIVYMIVFCARILYQGIWLAKCPTSNHFDEPVRRGVAKQTRPKKNIQIMAPSTILAYFKEERGTGDAFTPLPT